MECATIVNTTKRTIFKRHPLEFVVFLYETPEIPVLSEKPLVPNDPNFVLTLGEIPDLLILTPNPLPKFIRLENRNPIMSLF